MQRLSLGIAVIALLPVGVLADGPQSSPPPQDSIAIVALWNGASSGQQGTPDSIMAWIQSYDAAFNAKDLDRLAGFYHPEVTIFEGGSTNNGWADYRDNHIGPELKEMEDLQYSHRNVKVQMLGTDGRAAYVTSEYDIKTRVKGSDIDASGLETLVLVKKGDGGWQIRHSHTSSRRRPTPQPAGGGSVPQPAR